MIKHYKRTMNTLLITIISTIWRISIGVTELLVD